MEQPSIKIFQGLYAAHPCSVFNYQQIIQNIANIGVNKQDPQVNLRSIDANTSDKLSEQKYDWFKAQFRQKFASSINMSHRVLHDSFSRAYADQFNLVNRTGLLTELAGTSADEVQMKAGDAKWTVKALRKQILKDTKDSLRSIIKPPANKFYDQEELSMPNQFRELTSQYGNKMAKILPFIDKVGLGQSMRFGAYGVVPVRDGVMTNNLGMVGHGMKVPKYNMSKVTGLREGTEGENLLSLLGKRIGVDMRQREIAGFKIQRKEAKKQEYVRNVQGLKETTLKIKRSPADLAFH